MAITNPKTIKISKQPVSPPKTQPLKRDLDIK